MAYTAWSVVFGEQPSASKWNILGTNDASFNDGTGIGSGVISYTKLLSTIFSGQLVTTTNGGAGGGTLWKLQIGGLTILWGLCTAQTMTVNANLTFAITWGVTFASAPLIIANAYAPADNRMYAVITTRTTTTGTILLQSGGGAGSVQCMWLAIGTV